eukprot:794778-Pyramimonas_sp.AAC.2
MGGNRILQWRARLTRAQWPHGRALETIRNHRDVCNTMPIYISKAIKGLVSRAKYQGLWIKGYVSFAEYQGLRIKG